MKKYFIILVILFLCRHIFAQDTIVVQTFTLDSTSREGVFQFPDEPGATYEKIIMQYRMRCHDALVGNGNVGCYEWDYHCNTVVTDSSKTDSLWSTHPSHVIVGSDTNPYYYVLDPTYNYFQYLQQEVIYDVIISEDSAVIGNGTQILDIPFSTSNHKGKTQFLLTATELSNAGLSVGDITGLRLDMEELGSEVEFLKIKFKHTDKNELNNTLPDLEEFTEVYFLNTTFTSTGENGFNFYQPFFWNGASNIIIELSFSSSTAGNNSTVLGEDSGFNSTISTNSEDGFLSVNIGDYIEVPPEAFTPVDSFITVSFWQYGDIEMQPFNSYIFEGADANNNRVINCHLPWSNSRIYWDAGNSGTSSYDRIDKEAGFSEYAGQWNHWALTKNVATGEMKMYLNGSLWHSGSGKTRLMAGIVKFKIAGNKNEGRYAGFINEFRVWAAELDSSNIQQWMFRDIDPSHPYYSDLLLCYRLDEVAGETVTDHSQNGYDGTINGQPISVNFLGHQLSRNFIQSQLRPNIELVQGEYEQTINVTEFLDSLQRPFKTVYDYYVLNNDLFVNDTNYYYEAGYMPVFSESNILVDSIFILPADSIFIETLEYYQKWPSRFELVSFITPYGNGLDLGIKGKMWEFDVTDFAPILKGEKFLSMEGVGRWSEEYDIRFLFIEGTPPRNVLSIDPIWPIAKPGQIWYSFSPNDIWNDLKFEPRDLLMNPDASFFKIRSTITGHGQNGEFIPKWHYMNINGGDNEFEYKVWKECSEIPVYPQGGTWIYDRAGWCPGDPTTLFEFDITEFVTPGEVHTIDYGLTSIAGLNQADYRISNQFVTYGEPNHTLDAAIINVGKPNSEVAAFQRFNPICMEPAVVIQNTGETQLTSLEIEYHVEGGEFLYFSWTGTLDFLDTTEVELPVPDLSFWNGSSNSFYVEISLPNGQTDEYSNNNSYRITYEEVDTYEDDETIIVVCITNNWGMQNSYSITDVNGDIILQRDNLDNNTVYMDELTFTPGCYKLRMDDTGDNGLYFWATPAQGSGSIKLADENYSILKAFNSDFGGFFIYEFGIVNLTNSKKIDKTTILSVYPNPCSEKVHIDLTGFENKELSVKIYNASMIEMIENQFTIDSKNYHKEINIEDLPSGVYIIQIMYDDKISNRKIIKI